LDLPGGIVRPITLGEIHQAQFKVDSASGNYISAIHHFELYQNLHDSLFNATKNKQIQELQIQYETTKKDQDLLLKQKDIVVLKNEKKLQEASLKKASLTRKIIVWSAIALLALSFIGYRIKQRHNVALQLQQDEINEQNHQLQIALAQQKKLTIEKDWLMKEIHHRVKNNLQIIISLLNVQSDYLDSPSAINAIQESRERMQAIALIHQKLYQTDFGNSIDMKSYIGEMISYLQSFTDSGKIKLDLAIDDLNLDVSQAVPLGLILNEAITNALKYAFPDNEAGIIKIDLRPTKDEDILLKITDSGKGFPENFNFIENKSLGIQLIKLFAEQLDANLVFENNPGAQIQLNFKKKLPIDAISF
jgi:two-component sensor histidine kinase